MADAATNRKRQGVNTGCRHMWGRECVCVAARQGVKPLLALCTWKKTKNKKTKPLTCRHYELMASKGENLIWYKRHSDVRQKKGFWWWVLLIWSYFRWFASFTYVCVFCTWACVRGFPCRSPNLKIPFLGIPLSTREIKVCVLTESPLFSYLGPATRRVTPASHAESSEYRNLPHRNLLFATNVDTHCFIAWIVTSDLDVLLANEHICSLSAPMYLKVL